MRHSALDLSILAGSRAATAPSFLIHPAERPGELEEYRRMRREAFVVDQGLFAGTDRDDLDDDTRTVVLVATAPDGALLGGVRLAPHCAPDIGWWTGSRLVAAPSTQSAGVGAALIRAACAHVESAGALRFDATVQQRYLTLFTKLGWEIKGDSVIGGHPHVRMSWPINQIQRLAHSSKSYLATTLAPLRGVAGGLGPAGFVGDDGVPLPGSDFVAACDAIVPSMVERDPEWAGWCSVLVNVNDLAAMGATPVGLLDAIGAPTQSLLTRIVRGMARASSAWGVPVLGGHTQLGVPAALSVTALGRTTDPIPGGGGSVGDDVRLTVDLAGGWRPGYHGRQWDSTSNRSPDDLAQMGRLVAAMRPHAAKDVSMAGIAGTAGMLVEASGTGVDLDVSAIPHPAGVEMGAWLTCFPGFGMLTADRHSVMPPVPAGVASAVCGRLTSQPGVRLRWPDGAVTTVVSSAVTGLGLA